MSKNQSDNAKEIKLNADYKQWLAELKQDLEVSTMSKNQSDNALLLGNPENQLDRDLKLNGEHNQGQAAVNQIHQDPKDIMVLVAEMRAEIGGLRGQVAILEQEQPRVTINALPGSVVIAGDVKAIMSERKDQKPQDHHHYYYHYFCCLK